MTVAGTVPYAWPYNGTLTPSSVALVICGAQRQFVDASQAAQPARLNIERLKSSMWSFGAVVLASHHLAPGTLSARNGLLRPLELGSLADPRSELDPLIDEDQRVQVVTCSGYDAFYGSALESILRAQIIETLLVVGFASEVVVDSTLRAANDRGFECLVVSDAVAHIDTDLGKHQLSSITMSGGIFGALGSTAAVVAALSLLPTS